MIKDFLNETELFLKYREEIEYKDEDFENNPYITINLVKNKLNKSYSQNLTNNHKFNITINNIKLNDTNISNEHKKFLQKTNQNIISEYIKKKINEPFRINNLKHYDINLNPKISVIVPAHNCGKYLQNIHRSL